MAVSRSPLTLDLGISRNRGNVCENERRFAGKEEEICSSNGNGDGGKWANEGSEIEPLVLLYSRAAFSLGANLVQLKLACENLRRRS